MSLRDIQESDLKILMEDSVCGFGYEVTLTRPQGDSIQIHGLNTDIENMINPATGEVISGRRVTMTFRNSTIFAAGWDLPIGITLSAFKPWLVTVNDINGLSGVFKICHTMPDRTVGIIVCALEAYNGA